MERAQAAEGLDCGVPVPFSQFHKGLPMCGGKGGSDTSHKTSAAAGPSSDGGLLAGRVSFSGFSPTLTLKIKKMGTFLGGRDLSKSRHPPALHLLSSLRGVQTLHTVGAQVPG